MNLKRGKPAPKFTAVDQNGRPHSLADYRGQYLLLYFYPKDDTPGCTAEACGLRDSFTDLKAKAAVIGVSGDSVESHQAFAQKHGLPFPLLADPDRSIILAYGANGLIFNKRVSFLIDPKGIIAKVYPTVHPATHAADVLRDLETLQSK